MSSQKALWWIPSALLVLAASVTFPASIAFAQTTPAQETTADPAQQVKDAQQQLLKSAQENNKDSARAILDDNVVWVNRDGSVSTKEQWLGSTMVPPATVTPEDVRVIGKAVVVVGVAHFENGMEGRFVEQWVNRDGEWKLVAHEGTAVASSQPAATGTSGTNASMTKPERKAARRASMAPTLNSADERAVWKTQLAIQDAYLKGDAAAYSKLTADDYVRVNDDGQKVTRDEWLATVKKNAGRSGGKLDSDNVQVNVDGDTARIVMEMWGTQPGGDPEPAGRSLRIFQKRDGRWQQVAVALTPIEKK